MEIINETKITKEANKKMNKFLYRKKIIITLVILEIAFLGFSALIYFGLEEPMFALFVLLLAFLFPLILFINLRIAMKKAQKNNAVIVREPIVRYEFYEEYFSVSVEEKGFCSKSDYHYEVLCSILEAPEYFYFFITFNQVLIVSKDGFISGSVQDLKKYIGPYIKKNI